jgi:hypothetical protein
MTIKPQFPDLNALAIEACDMWQDHLSTLASDPNARAELTRYLEPQRRLFADWAAMMQQGVAQATTPPQQGASHESHSAKNTEKSAADSAASPTSTTKASGGSAHGDDPLRAAQLALRVAELEKRIAQLESKLAESFKSKAGTSGATQRKIS